MCLSDFEAFLKAKLANPDPLATDEDKLAELAKWEKFTLSRWGKANPRPFNPEKTRGDLADFVQSALDNTESDVAPIEAVKGVFAQAREKVAYKAIQATRSGFEVAFEENLARARSGEIDRRTFAQNLRGFIRRFGLAAYKDGIEDGGADPDEMTDEDFADINKLIREQSQYVSSFGAELYKAITDAEAANKPALWFKKSIMPFYDAGLLSAAKNQMMEWVMNAQAENCASCLKLDGQRHRLKTFHSAGFIPGDNGHKSLICNMGCKCRFVQVTGRARGRLDRIPTA